MAASSSTGKSRTARKAPADRLASTKKGPRVERATVPLDDEAAADLRDAQRALADARNRQQTNRQRRINQARLADRAADPLLIEELVDEVMAEDLAPLEHAVADARDRVAATSRTYTFHSLGRKRWQALIADHPAQDADHEKVKAQGQGTKALFHMDTFVPALIQTACVDPVLTDADIDGMFDDEQGGAWNDAELDQLFMAAYAANTQRRVVEL